MNEEKLKPYIEEYKRKTIEGVHPSGLFLGWTTVIL